VGALPGRDAATSGGKGVAVRIVRMWTTSFMRRGTDVLMYDVHLDPKALCTFFSFLFYGYGYGFGFGLGLDFRYLASFFFLSVIWHRLARAFLF